MVWIAVVMSALLVLIGCPLLLKTWLQRKNWVSVKATCIECEFACGKKEKKYKPLLTYEYAGRTYNAVSATTTPELEVDEVYPCCCDPEHPETIILEKQKHESLGIAVGCVLALAASIVWLLFDQGVIKL